MSSPKRDRRRFCLRPAADSNLVPPLLVNAALTVLVLLAALIIVGWLAPILLVVVLIVPLVINYRVLTASNDGD